MTKPPVHAVLIENSPMLGRAHRRYRRLRLAQARWREFSQMPARDRERIIALEAGQYRVGLDNARNRDTWVAKALAEIPAGWRLLDAGAGECQYKPHCSHLDYVSQDISQYDGSGASGLQTGKWDTSRIDIVSDIVAMPLENEAFDAVLCTEVLEHVPDPPRALDEMARVLRVGGVMIVTTPFCSLTHFAPYHFATGFNRYFFEHHMPALGMEIVELVPSGNYFEFVAQEVRRIEDMASRYAGAKATTIEQHAMMAVLGLLERLSETDKGSSELLNYQYFVKARKVRHVTRSGRTAGEGRAP